MATNSLIIQTYIAKENDIELQLVLNSTERNRKMQASSDKISRIHDQYDNEEDIIRNEMKELGDNTSDEYTELMYELKSLQDEEDEKVEAVENEESNFESENDTEDTCLESMLEATKQDHEGFKQARNDDLKSFNYTD